MRFRRARHAAFAALLLALAAPVAAQSDYPSPPIRVSKDEVTGR